MTSVEADVLDEFNLDIQIDETNETDLPARKYAPRGETTVTAVCSCTWCCPSRRCSPGLYCS
jgi:hypothetical protein